MEFWRAVFCSEAQENPLSGAGKNFAERRKGKAKLKEIFVRVQIKSLNKFYDQSRAKTKYKLINLLIAAGKFLEVFICFFCLFLHPRLIFGEIVTISLKLSLVIGCRFPLPVLYVFIDLSLSFFLALLLSLYLLRIIFVLAGLRS